MPPQTFVGRVESLESRVIVLEQLPEKIDALALQISQMRNEMRGEFSALRSEIRTGDEETRRVLRDEIRAGDEETRRVLRDEIRAGDEETRRILRDEIRAGDEETRRILRDEIRAGDEESRRHALVLHEDVISRIALMQEGTRGETKRPGTRGDLE
jgi:hypothetical protein